MAGTDVPGIENYVSIDDIRTGRFSVDEVKARLAQRHADLKALRAGLLEQIGADTGIPPDQIVAHVRAEKKRLGFPADGNAWPIPMMTYVVPAAGASASGAVAAVVDPLADLTQTWNVVFNYREEYSMGYYYPAAMLAIGPNTGTFPTLLAGLNGSKLGSRTGYWNSCQGEETDSGVMQVFYNRDLGTRHNDVDGGLRIHFQYDDHLRVSRDSLMTETFMNKAKNGTLTVDEVVRRVKSALPV